MGSSEKKRAYAICTFDLVEDAEFCNQLRLINKLRDSEIHYKEDLYREHIKMYADNMREIMSEDEELEKFSKNYLGFMQKDDYSRIKVIVFDAINKHGDIKSTACEEIDGKFRPYIEI
ncbi:MAG: hypothetical protein ACRCX2_36895 [Paraclostridium sp.]